MTPRVLRIFNAVATINFLAFWVVASLMGDAINGHAADGHYFLKSHSGLTEVSHAVFIYSWLHALSVFVTVPLATAANLIWGRRHAEDRSEKGSR